MVVLPAASSPTCAEHVSLSSQRQEAAKARWLAGEDAVAGRGMRTMRIRISFLLNSLLKSFVNVSCVGREQGQSLGHVCSSGGLEGVRTPMAPRRSCLWPDGEVQNLFAEKSRKQRPKPAATEANANARL